MSGPQYAGFVVEGFTPAHHAAVVEGFRAALAEPSCAQWLSEFGGGAAAESRTVLFIPYAGACWLRFVWEGCSDESEYLLVVSFGDEIAKEIAKRTHTPVWLYAYNSTNFFGIDAKRFSPHGDVLETLAAGDNTEIPDELKRAEDFDIAGWLSARVHQPMCERIGWNELVMQRARTGPAFAPPWLAEKCETFEQPLDGPLVPKLFSKIRATLPVAEPVLLSGPKLYFPLEVRDELTQLATEWGWTVNEVLQLVWERAKAKLHAELAPQAAPGFPFPMPPAGSVKLTTAKSKRNAPALKDSGEKAVLRVSFEQVGEVQAFAIAADCSLSAVLQRAYDLARPSLWLAQG